MRNIEIATFILEKRFFLIIIYIAIVIPQVVWLYYERTLKNVFLFLGHKLIIVISLLFLYFSNMLTETLLFYIFSTVVLIKIVEWKMKETFFLSIDNLFLQDPILLLVSGIISFYLI